MLNVRTRRTIREVLQPDQPRTIITNMTDGLHLRSLNDTDPEVMAAALSAIGWQKPSELFQRYLAEQASGTRSCWVANLTNAFAGYITINWEPTYPWFAARKIPEIQDLNVLPSFRRRGIGTSLLDQAEAQIACHSDVVGIGVGLHPGYNDAHSLYVKRGYIPDGRGVTYRDRYLQEGEQVVLDDDLLLHLIRHIRP
jgi:GNAT superfamily N-acetyltransferase